MSRFVALLRGVNVGKAKRVPMAELRALLVGLGCADVQTALNSGNAVFSSPGRSAPAQARAIGAALVERFGFEVPVVVKTATAFGAAVASCPFTAHVPDPARLFVVFTQDGQTLAGLSKLLPLVQPPETFALGEHAAYLHCAGSVLDSKLARALLGKSGDAVTSRNWSTVLKIQRLLDAAAT